MCFNMWEGIRRICSYKISEEKECSFKVVGSWCWEVFFFFFDVSDYLNKFDNVELKFLTPY